MQQRLAVASVLVLVLLAGGTAVFIQSHASGQSAPSGNANLPQGQSNEGNQNSATTSSGSTSTTNSATNSTSTGGGLLVSGTQTHTCSDDCGVDDDLNNTVTTTTGTSTGTATTYMDE